MSGLPILVIQMLRMGDLILSFPLLQLLQKLYPQNPIWVVGAKQFMEPLQFCAPEARYIAYEGNERLLLAQKYHLVINLSHRSESAVLAGSAQSEALLGLYQSRDGATYIQGNWHLYRASLVHNNKYNNFHWSDLFLLDCVPLPMLQQYVWPSQKRKKSTGSVENKQIGLFLGASEPEKHPDETFWIDLVRLVCEQGHGIELYGGPAEIDLGTKVMTQSGLSGEANLCGKLTLSEVAEAFNRLDLLITPDTGPMHLAVWQGVPVCNLAMGQVNSWETGPNAPGHVVLNSFLECTGCWSCFDRSFRCKDQFMAERIMPYLGDTKKTPDVFLDSHQNNHLDAFITCRDSHGLFSLEHFSGTATSFYEQTNSPVLARRAWAHFWRSWFGYALDLFSSQGAVDQLVILHEVDAAGVESVRKGLLAFIQQLTRLMRSSTKDFLVDENSWKQFPQEMLPLTGYIHMYLQNSCNLPRALGEVLLLVERLYVLL